MNSPSSVSLSYMSAAANPLSSPWPFAGLIPVHPCLSCTGEPRIGSNTPGVSHQFSIRGRITAFRLLAMLFLMQPQMLLALFCCKGPVLADVQLCACQGFRVLFCKAAFQLVGLQPVMLPGFFSSQVQNFALPFVELHGNPVC